MPYFANGDWKWRRCEVQSYDAETKMFKYELTAVDTCQKLPHLICSPCVSINRRLLTLAPSRTHALRHLAE